MVGSVEVAVEGLDFRGGLDPGVMLYRVVIRVCWRREGGLVSYEEGPEIVGLVKGGGGRGSEQSMRSGTNNSPTKT